MNVFDDYTRSLLEVLNRNQVKYLVVGGYAVNYYGYRRTTGDIDLWIKPDNGENKSLIIESLKQLGVEEKMLSSLNDLDFTRPIMFVDGEEPFKIDFMTFVNTVSFDDAWEQQSKAVLDGIEVPFIHLNHLIVTKMTTGRTKDKLDIEELQKILSRKKNQ